LESLLQARSAIIDELRGMLERDVAAVRERCTAYGSLANCCFDLFIVWLAEQSRDVQALIGLLFAWQSNLGTFKHCRKLTTALIEAHRSS
jgi:hypothetical protein